MKTFIILLLVMTLSFASCKKFLQIDTPQNLIETSNVFSNDQGAISATMGVYAQLRQTNLSLLNGGVNIYTGLYSDEIYNTTSSASIDAFTTNSLTSSLATISSLWTTSYSGNGGIYQVNSILEGLKASSQISDSVKQQLTGEMKFIRALYYFNLVNLFGDIPLVTGTDYKINSSLGRVNLNEVYDQIVSDLRDAESILKPAYPSSNRARPNKWAAAALLAKVYLYQKKWTEAESEVSTVIGSNAYSLASLNNVFLTTSSETIFQLISDFANTAEASNFVPTSSTVKPAYALTPFLMNAFETGDLRKTSWLSSNTISSQIYYFPNKYKSRVSTPITESEVILRLGELYLIRAEARAQLNKIPESKSDLNTIRNRAGLSNTVANDQTTVLTAIEHERQVELFTEGNRFFDLKRLGRADIVLGLEKTPNWQSTDALFPIPLSQILINPLLIQNPGY